MAETIYRGYVVNKYPFQVFDEIVTFLIENGRKIPCLSRGSRKIESKNARNLFIGSYVEFQIFQSRSDDKISRLKKSNTIKSIDWNYETIESFNLLNECATVTNVKGKELYTFYQDNLEMIQKQTFNDKIIVLVILRQFLKISGVMLEVNRCVKCGSNKIKTISFKEHGLLCNLCFDSKNDKFYELPISKAIHYLFNNQYDKLNGYLHEIDFLIKLIRIYTEDNLGIKLKTLAGY